MTYGQQNTEAEGHEQMDYALERGVTFFDTAEMYAIPPKPETQGSTERIIGSWFKARKNRDKVILATKVAGRSFMNWMRDDGSPARLTRGQMTEALEKSLKRSAPTISIFTRSIGPSARSPGAPIRVASTRRIMRRP